MIATASLWRKQKAAPRKHEEDSLQIAIVKFLAVALPPHGICFMVPNGGKRSRVTAARYKAMGLLRGVPDLCVIVAGRTYFLELKAGRGVLSQDQRDTMRRLNYCGAECMVVRSIAEAEASLRECGVHLRGTVAA